MTDLVQRLRGWEHWGHTTCLPMGEIADRIEQLEAEVLEQCRINGMGAERELALMAKVERLERENAELRKDAERYRWLAAYFVSDSTEHDDAIVAASEVGVANLNTAIDEAMKS